MPNIERQRARYWNLNGEAMLFQGRLDDALECFRRSLLDDPSYSDAAQNMEVLSEKHHERSGSKIHSYDHFINFRTKMMSRQELI